MNKTNEPVTKWYQEPYSWMVFGIPLGTIAACMLMISIASSNPDGLVIDDYYKEGLAINRVLAREARAKELGLAVARLDIGEREYQLALHLADGASPLPAQVDVLFAHATRTTTDRATVASAIDSVSGVYRGPIEDLEVGPWYVAVSADDWRLVHRIDVRR